MEFEDVNEEIEWEARRVAVAFGVSAFESRVAEKWERNYQGESNAITVYWSLDVTKHTLTYISIAYGSGCEVEVVRLFGESSTRWHLEWEITTTPSSRIQELLARHLAFSLHRLGFEDESVLTQLPLLSAHERLELRLSMPREFWPKKWLDEEG